MEGYFKSQQILPGIHHIQELDVCMTLLVGKERALLFDTGYGACDLAEYIDNITKLPLSVINSHAHPDHVCGNVRFKEVYIDKADMERVSQYNSRTLRENVIAQAGEKLLLPPNHKTDEYLNAPFASMRELDVTNIDLGGMEVDIIKVPGHTPGSITLFVKPHNLLLTADTWNPTTWLQLNECLPLYTYINNVHKLLDVPFENVLCSHRTELFPRERLVNFINGLTRETLLNAEIIKPGFWGTPTKMCHPEPETNFLFCPENLYEAL